MRVHAALCLYSYYHYYLSHNILQRIEFENTYKCAYPYCQRGVDTCISLVAVYTLYTKLPLHWRLVRYYFTAQTTHTNTAAWHSRAHSLAQSVCESVIFLCVRSRIYGYKGGSHEMLFPALHEWQPPPGCPLLPRVRSASAVTTSGS